MDERLSRDDASNEMINLILEYNSEASFFTGSFFKFLKAKKHKTRDKTYRNVDFKGLNLSGVDFSGTTLHECRLDRCALTNVIFHEAVLNKVSVIGVIDLDTEKIRRIVQEAKEIKLIKEEPCDIATINLVKEIRYRFYKAKYRYLRELLAKNSALSSDNGVVRPINCYFSIQNVLKTGDIKESGNSHRKMIERLSLSPRSDGKPFMFGEGSDSINRSISNSVVVEKGGNVGSVELMTGCARNVGENTFEPAAAHVQKVMEKGMSSTVQVNGKVKGSVNVGMGTIKGV